MFQDSTPDRRSPYHELMNKVGWFFFDLLVLGYVEDPSSGKSFHFPANRSWKLFIEVSYTITFASSIECVQTCVVQVPSRSTKGEYHENLEQFKTEVPVLGLLGTPVAIEHTSKFSITSDVQLVCKYLKAFETKRIDKLYRERMLFHVLSITFGNSKFMFCIHFQIILWLSSVQILNLQKRSVKSFSNATCLIILRRIRSLRSYSSSAFSKQVDNYCYVRLPNCWSVEYLLLTNCQL